MRATLIVLLSIASLSGPQVAGQAAKVGECDRHGDIGSPKIAGSAAFNPVSQEYWMAAAGTNMWGQRDEFHFVWKRMTGDFILQARVQRLGKGVEAHRKVGLIARSGQDANAPYVETEVADLNIGDDILQTRAAPVDAAGSGTPRVIAYVFGGHGTINVPSWSPDGKTLAFVSNTGPY